MKRSVRLPLVIASLILSGAPGNQSLAIGVSTSAQLKSACQNAAPGDVIMISSGTYVGPFTLVNKTNVTIKRQAGKVKLLGNQGLNNPDFNNSNDFAILFIQNSSNITIQDLEFVENWGNGANGISVGGTGNGITISSCKFYNIGWSKNKGDKPTSSNNAHAMKVVGLAATSYSNILISGNTIHDCITGYSESLTLTGNVSNFRIEGNTLYGNTNIGIDCAGHYIYNRTPPPPEVNYARNGIVKNNTVYNFAGRSDLPAAAGIYVDGGSYITIENNKVYKYKVGISIGCENPGKTNRGNIVRNNLIYNASLPDTSLSGIFVGSSAVGSMVDSTQITNNTLFKNGFGSYDNGQIALFNNNHTVIKNNILFPTNNRYALVQMSDRTSMNLSISHNLYFRDNKITDDLYFNIPIAISGDNSAIKLDPLFASAPADFHLKAGSPAIDRGDPNLDVTGQVDLDGYARVYNSRVDIGVDEAAPPPDPSVLHVTVLSPSQLKLTWKDNSINERGFKIERSIGVSTTFTQIATVGAGVISYTNSNLTASTKYNYRVRSYNDFGSSMIYAAASGTTSAPTSVPLAPSALTLGPITADQIWLKWTDNSNDETGFKIEWSHGTSTTYTQIATVGAGITTYGNVGLNMSTKYNYRVWAYNGIGISTSYAAASGTTTGIASAQKAVEATASNNLKASLYPNPVTNSFTISLRKASSEITATVSDIKGSVFIVKKYSGAHQQQFKFDVNALKPGSYFLQIKTIEGIEVLKFLKF